MGKVFPNQLDIRTNPTDVLHGPTWSREFLTVTLFPDAGLCVVGKVTMARRLTVFLFIALTCYSFYVVSTFSFFPHPVRQLSQ